MKWSIDSKPFLSRAYDKIGTVDIDKLNKGKDDDLLPPLSQEPGLFELYRDSLGIISANEADGGWVNTLKAGVVWDSRDNRPNPMKGIWTELGFELAPGFLGNDWSFTKFYITHRQYFTLVENNLSLVYRLGYQATISGETPFFYQSQMITSRLTGALNEGLGGFSTLRGVLKNRVVGEGFALHYLAYLPAPVDMRPVLGHNPLDEEEIIERPDTFEAPFCALAFKIVTDTVLQNLAAICPVTPEALLKTPGISPRFADRYGMSVLGLLLNS